jgi:two-component system, OmpR family, osmolarity sensor histidine kinase EnvZ
VPPIHLAPRSLLWRTFFLIALLIGLALATWFQLFVRFESEPRARQLGQMLVSVVNLTRAALVNADPLLRLALLRDLSVQEGIRIYPAEPGDELGPLPDSPTIRVIAAEVQRQLGPDTRFAGSREGIEGIWVSFQIDPDDPSDLFWVMLPRERFERVRTAEWLGWGIAAAILAMFGAYIIVRRVAGPLAQITKAARQIGRGEPVSRLPEEGPSEISEVSRAFNQMSDDLAQLESDRALILAGVSHDLRTPLARLRLGIEMTGAHQDDIDAMSADVEEMDKIIAQFLDFARGSADESMVELDGAALVADLVASYQRRGLANVVSGTVDSAHARFDGKPKAMRRAVSNLIDNALRYAGEANEIELGCVLAGNNLVFSVLDRGPGIPADQVERLKRPFTRLEAARTDARGSGLGLAIVDRVARAHGGRLDLLPRTGGGLNAQILVQQSFRPANNT